MHVTQGLHTRAYLCIKPRNSEKALNVYLQVVVGSLRFPLRSMFFFCNKILSWQMWLKRQGMRMRARGAGLRIVGAKMPSDGCALLRRSSRSGPLCVCIMDTCNFSQVVPVTSPFPVWQLIEVIKGNVHGGHVLGGHPPCCLAGAKEL